jgi:hypothetical protein
MTDRIPLEESLAERLNVALRLYLFALFGLFLMITPWTPLWDQMTLPLAPTRLGGWLRGGWLRGLVSAVGALDLLVAFREAGGLWRRLRGASR